MPMFFVFLLPVLIVVGAFMWMKPSRRDQYLAKLRASAIGHGFKLGSLRVPDLTEFGRVNEKYQIVTLYQKTIVVADKEVHPTLTVLRTSGQSGAFLPDGWQWERRNGLSDQQYQELSDLLELLPLSVNTLDVSRETLGLSWDERDDDITFEQLTETIRKAADIFSLKLV